MSYKGIDVSSWQGLINWEAVKPQIDFAIIRASFKYTLDSRFIRNITECNRLGIPVGVYVYSYALNEEEAKKEAEFLISAIKPYKIQLPVAIDMEDADGYKKRHGFPSKETLQNICKIECDIFKANGYVPMIYASKNWFDNYLTSIKLEEYKKWLAWWNMNARFDINKYQFWQNSSNGIVVGINGNVDTNLCYEDISKIVENVDNFVEKPKFVAGRNYYLLEDMNVRYGAGTNWNVKPRSELTSDGKKHSFDQYYGVLKKGTMVTCLGVIENGSDIWLRIPSGFVAAFYKGHIYIE